MEKTIMFIIPIFFLILIVGIVGSVESNIFYLEITGEATKEFQDEENKKIEEEGLIRDTYYVNINPNGLEPEFINGSRGSWVVFTNNDSKVRRLATDFGVDTGDLEPGDSYRKYLSNSGEYSFTDKYNPDIVFVAYIGVEFHKN